MFLESCNAIIALLNLTFPDITAIYTNHLPDGYAKPSFSLQLAAGSEEPSTYSTYRSQATWRISYAPMDLADGNWDAVGHLQTLDALKDVLMASMKLRNGDDAEFGITSVETSLREDNTIYVAVTLEAEFEREKPATLTMETVHIRTEG